MQIGSLKRMISGKPTAMRIWRGPFRGAHIVMSPRNSLRKAAGLYERELNPWIDQAMRQVRRVLDVGANDGYFCIGCATAFRRLGRSGTVIAFEPAAPIAALLRRSVTLLGAPAVPVEIVEAFVGGSVGPGKTSLDALATQDRRDTLIKIDVEGAELEVIAGARSWLEPSNHFLIEVHEERFIAELHRIFGERGMTLRLIRQRPLPILGAEAREPDNCWLVSDARSLGDAR